MRKPKFSLYERTLLYCIAGQLFRQAPNRQPRKVETIMQKARDAFRADAVNDNEWYHLSIDEDSLYSYIDKLLKSIPEFEELNLSQVEFENGVGVHDESRPKFHFSTAYDKETSESWKRDFIDLDAFIRNVVNEIYNQHEFDMDCFGCIYDTQGNDKCMTCRLNPHLEINLEYARQPKGDYTFSCKYDCYRDRYICCEECKDQETCDKKCTSCSDECGLALHKGN